MTDFYDDEHMARLAILARAWDYTSEGYSDQCEACVRGDCVQRVEYYFDGNGMPCQYVTHNMKHELN